MAHDPHTKMTLARARLTSQLRKSELPGAAALAAVLAACTPSSPCRSAACPVCGLEFQATAVALVEEFIRKPSWTLRNRMTAITVVPTSGCVPPDVLAVEHFERVGAEIIAAFTALNLPATIIGLEASFNEDLTGEVEDHWCGHGHALQSDWLAAHQERALKDFFPRSSLVKRPIRCDKLDRRSAGLQYPFKPERARKVAWLNTSDPERAPFRATKRRELRSEQAPCLALVEHQLGFGRRLLTHGINERVVRQRLEAAGWARDGP